MTEHQSPYNVTVENHEPPAAATGDAVIVALFDELLEDAYLDYSWHYLHPSYSDKHRALNQAEWDQYAAMMRARLRKALGGR